MIDFVVFDLDGTLVDSRRDIADAVNSLIVERGGARIPDDEVVLMVGEGVRLLVERAFAAAALPSATGEAVARFREIYGQRLLVHTRPYPGIAAAVAALSSRVKLAVLSNKPADASREVLEGLGLAAFFWRIAGGESSFPRKPDPAGLVDLMDGAGTTPARTLLVGDSKIDLRTARNAGTRICLVRWGFGWPGILPTDLDGREIVIDTAEELVSIVRDPGSRSPIPDP